MRQRTSRTPLLVLGAVAGLTCSVGAGAALGAYTVTGMDPFYTTQQPAFAYHDEAVGRAGSGYVDPDDGVWQQTGEQAGQPTEIAAVDGGTIGQN